MTVLLQWSRGDFGSPQENEEMKRLISLTKNNCRQVVLQLKAEAETANRLESWCIAMLEDRRWIVEPAEPEIVRLQDEVNIKKADAARGHCSGRENLKERLQKLPGPESFLVRWRRDTGQLS
jgi:hypothetical protein